MKVTVDGKELEVFTSEDVTKAAETAKAEAVEAYKTANPDKSAELADLQTKLADAEKALAEGDDEDGQKRRLRQERDDAKKALADGLSDVEKKIDQKLQSAVGENTKTELLDTLAKGDAELRKKIEFEFDSYQPNNNTRKGITERMQKAYQLATGQTPGFLDGTTGASDRGDGGGYRPADNKEVTPNEKAIGLVLGVTDADREVYKKFKAEQEVKRAAGLIPPQ